MPQLFKQIGLIGKTDSVRSTNTLLKIADFLNQRGRKVILDERLQLTNPNFEVHNISDIGKSCDLAIVVGGDGTLLNTARSLVDFEIPILGINRGRLGFLVDVSPNNLSEIDTILTGNFIEDARMMLDVKIFKNDIKISHGQALNDAVLYKWNTARMIEFDINIDGKLLNSHRSDGLIISTPTGSTAYALSGGGPLVHPKMDAFLLVPICPHTLSNRPFMIGDSSTIEIIVNPESLPLCRISCDGQQDLELDDEVKIIITKKENKIKLIHPPNYDFFEILRAKLRWGDHSLGG